MAFQVADRVRVIATGETGSVAWVDVTTVGLLLDGKSLSEGYQYNEIELYDGPPATPPPQPQPVREGLPGVGDALLGLATVLGAQLPDNPIIQGKLAELRAAVESAMPAETIYDDQGNGWKRCGPGCDLAVVEPGKTVCTGAGGCTR